MKKILQLNISSPNQESLFLYRLVLNKIFKNLNLTYKVFNLPIKKRKLTLNRSPHVNKTSREQFEIRLYKSIFQISLSNVQIPLKFLFINKPKTVTIKIKQLN